MDRSWKVNEFDRTVHAARHGRQMIPIAGIPGGSRRRSWARSGAREARRDLPGGQGRSTTSSMLTK